MNEMNGNAIFHELLIFRTILFSQVKVFEMTMHVTSFWHVYLQLQVAQHSIEE